MRHFSILTILILIMLVGYNIPAFCAVKGGVEYSIPIDYKNLNEDELSIKARKYYFNATKLKDGEINSDMTNALFLYNVLQNKNPENIDYILRAGILYDKLGKDRHAKGAFSKAIAINSEDCQSYYYLGEFYYKREMYRKALRYYNESYKRNNESNYDMLVRIADIYEKLGDSKSALKYLNDAVKINPNSEIENKIKRVESQDLVNKEYYSNTRIRGVIP